MNSEIVRVEDFETGEQYEVEVFYEVRKYTYGADADDRRGETRYDRIITDVIPVGRVPAWAVDLAVESVVEE